MLALRFRTSCQNQSTPFSFILSNAQRKWITNIHPKCSWSCRQQVTGNWLTLNLEPETLIWPYWSILHVHLATDGEFCFIGIANTGPTGSMKLSARRAYHHHTQNAIDSNKLAPGAAVLWSAWVGCPPVPALWLRRSTAGGTAETNFSAYFRNSMPPPTTPWRISNLIDQYAYPPQFGKSNRCISVLTRFMLERGIQRVFETLEEPLSYARFLSWRQPKSTRSSRPFFPRCQIFDFNRSRFPISRSMEDWNEWNGHRSDRMDRRWARPHNLNHWKKELDGGHGDLMVWDLLGSTYWGIESSEPEEMERKKDGLTP